MEFKFVIGALKVFGLFVPTEEKATRRRVLWFYASLIPCTVMDVLLSVHAAIHCHDALSKVWCAFHIISGLKSHFRRFYFVFKLKDITELLRMIEKPAESEVDAFSRADEAMRAKSAAKIERFNKVLFSYNVCSTCTAVIVPNLVRVATTLAENWGSDVKDATSSQPLMALVLWPSDPLRLPTYYFIIAWQCAAFIIYTGVAFSTDGFVCSLMLSASERASLLSRTAPQALLPGPSNQITPHFKDWVLYHQHYIRIVNAINEVMGPFIFIINAFSCLLVVMYSYALLKSPDYVTRSNAAFCLSGMLIRIYVDAIAGQRILDKSIQLCSSVVGVSQVSRGGLGAGPARSALQVLVTRLSAGADPEGVSGVGFFTVCKEFFNSVLSACFSYLMVLLRFK